MKISNLPNKVQNNDHKYAQRTQEMNRWKRWEEFSNKQLENIKKEREMKKIIKMKIHWKKSIYWSIGNHSRQTEKKKKVLKAWGQLQRLLEWYQEY